jgi:hypothetical protein
LGLEREISEDEEEDEDEEKERWEYETEEEEEVDELDIGYQKMIQKQQDAEANRLLGENRTGRLAANGLGAARMNSP